MANLNKENLQLIFEAAGKNKSQIARELGVKSTSVKEWIEGVSRPSQKNQAKIRNTFRLQIAKLYK